MMTWHRNQDNVNQDLFVLGGHSPLLVQWKWVLLKFRLLNEKAFTLLQFKPFMQVYRAQMKTLVCPIGRDKRDLIELNIVIQKIIAFAIFFHYCSSLRSRHDHHLTKNKGLKKTYCNIFILWFFLLIRRHFAGSLFGTPNVPVLFSF